MKLTEKPLDRQEIFLLDWLSKEETSAYGECRGITLDSLTDRGFVGIAQAPRGLDENYARVFLTEAGRTALKEQEQGR